MSARRVAVTGIGVVAPNGVTTRAFWDATVAGVSGIKPITAFDPAEYSCRIAGQVGEFDIGDPVPPRAVKRMDRFARLGVAASVMAVADSGLDFSTIDPNTAGCVVGSGMGGALFHEEQLLLLAERGPSRLSAWGVPRITPNAVAAHIALVFNLQGPSLVVSTACASGTHAVGEALRKIQHGEADVILAGGAEAPITPGTFAAYCSLRALSSRNDAPEKASRPFDAGRDGFVVAEGGAILVLEELGQALDRGARIYAEIIGYAASCGAHHMVVPDPTGSDAARAIGLAMTDARVAPADVDYINAHGTSTLANDVAETKAIKIAFGDGPSTPPISATKSVTGHALGATGAIEAAVCCLAIADQTIPPTANYEEPDPECDLDYVPNEARPADIGVVLSNSFGFGSVNACLLFRKP
ncbi:MAG TPA: beta-ketoacyl-ACP synthase II [Armatimonadota bacterium]|nr:beta-ketoacyl-ACP synthase II [Armatimonadota bacterium]